MRRGVSVVAGDFPDGPCHADQNSGNQRFHATTFSRVNLLDNFYEKDD
jgi:hypothetical protein